MAPVIPGLDHGWGDARLEEGVKNTEEEHVLLWQAGSWLPGLEKGAQPSPTGADAGSTLS